MADITLPPLPPMTHYGGQAAVMTAGDIQNRDIVIARLVLEGAAKVCDAFKDKTLAAQSCDPSGLSNIMLRQIAVLGFGESASAIRAMKVKYHE